MDVLHPLPCRRKGEDMTQRRDGLSHTAGILRLFALSVLALLVCTGLSHAPASPLPGPVTPGAPAVHGQERAGSTTCPSPAAAGSGNTGSQDQGGASDRRETDPAGLTGVEHRWMRPQRMRIREAEDQTEPVHGSTSWIDFVGWLDARVPGFVPEELLRSAVSGRPGGLPPQEAAGNGDGIAPRTPPARDPAPRVS